MTYPLFELGIHRIECPVPFVQAGGPANIYVIDEADGGVALFDSGIGTPPGEQALREGFAKIGRRLGDVRRIYLSHGHIDHYGLARTISEESGAEVYIHEADRLKVERPNADWKASREAYWEYLTHLGVSHDEMTSIERGHLATLTMARPVERTKPVRDGDVLQFKNFSAKVLHSPGHTPGLTCLYVESHRVLFSDDHLLEIVSPNPLIEVGPEGADKKFRSLVTYLQTLERTRSLAVDLVLPGHNAPFRDPVSLIDRLRGFYEKRQRRILEALESGPKTAVELLQYVFPRAGTRELFLTLSEVVGNLEVLEERGEVVRRAPVPLYRWERITPM